MKNLKGKTIVITGAGSGIGQELAIQLEGWGATLVLTDWKTDLLRVLKNA